MSAAYIQMYPIAKTDQTAQDWMIWVHIVYNIYTGRLLQSPQTVMIKSQFLLIVLKWFFVRFDTLRPNQQFFSSVGMGLPGLNQYVKKQGLMCLAQGHNAVMWMRLDPATPRS